MKLANLFAIVCTTALVAACDGDGNGSFTDGLFGDPGSGQFNGPLQGQVLIDGKLVDLPTGVVRVVVPTYDDGDEPVVTASANGLEFIEVQQYCDFENLQIIDCLIFRNAQGTESSRYPMRGWSLQGKLPELSPDGQFVTVLDVDEQALLIIDRTGNVVDHSRQYVANSTWTRDGALVYSSGQSIYLADPSQLFDQTADTLIRSFDASAGSPLHLSVSPDGNRIAFSLATENTYATYRGAVWTMNIDGGDPQLFAHSQSGFENRAGWPHWSPDGQWILVRQETLLPGHGPGRAGSQTALRSDIASHELDNESESQIKLRAICFRKPECSQQEVNVLNPGPIAWVASAGG